MPDYGTYSSPASGVTTTRSGKLLSKVQWYLAGMDQGKLADVLKLLPEQFIFDELNRAQSMLAEDLLCIETSASVTFTSGVGAEPTGFYRMKQLKLSTSQLLQPIEVSGEQYDDIIRTYTSGGQTPTWYWRWGGNITLFPVPATGSYTVYYYGVPTTTIAQATEPQIPAYMDEAMLFYAVKELAVVAGRNDLVPLCEGKYARELDRIKLAWRRTKTVLYEIEKGPY